MTKRSPGRSALGVPRGRPQYSGRLTLKGEPLRDRAREVVVADEVAVVARRLAGQRSMKRVVKVVRPDGVEAEPARARGQHEPPVVVVRLGDHVDAPSDARGLAPDGVGELGEDVDRARIVDGVDRVEAEAVDVELAHPQCARCRSRGAARPRSPGRRSSPPHPRRRVAVREVRTVLGEIVPLRPEVVVRRRRETPRGRAAWHASTRRAAEPRGPPYVECGAYRCDAVVAPVARPRELGDRHQLERGDAEISEPRQMGDDAPRRSPRA